VSNDDCGDPVFTLEDVVDGFLDFGFVLSVESRGCFIEDQDGRVLDEGSGNGDSLFLSARELTSC
jgi:hypothetical protein